MTSRVSVVGLALCAVACVPPPEPEPKAKGVVAIYAGGAKTCAVIDETKLRCWGRNDEGRLGFALPDGAMGDDEPASAVPLLDLGVPINRVEPSTSLACLSVATGELRCWGGGNTGSLGFIWDGPLGDDETLLAGPSVDFGDDRLLQVATGSSHTCAVFEGGHVKCWGSGRYGGTGYASTENLGDDPGEEPKDLPPVDVGGPVRALAAGTNYTCAVMEDGGLRCWGSNVYGRLGLGLSVDSNLQTIHIGDDETPSSVEPIQLAGGPVIQVAAQGRQVCALHEEGTVSCWGETGPWLGYGKAMDAVGVGYGDDELPLVLGLVDIGGKVVEIVVGDAFTCVRLENGGVKCWGASNFGQLGYGNTDYVGYSETPAEVGSVELGNEAIALAAGWDHACALLADHTVRCWGIGGSGVLGYGTAESIGDDEVPLDAGPVPVL